MSKFKKRFMSLFRHPFLCILTAAENFIILLGSSLLCLFVTNTQKTGGDFFSNGINDARQDYKYTNWVVVSEFAKEFVTEASNIKVRFCSFLYGNPKRLFS